MSRSDEKLRRLLAAAKTAPTASAPPFGLEARVLANWREQEAADESLPLLAFLRRATLGAGLVLALCTVWSLTQAGGNVALDEAAQLDYNIQMSLNP